jgi:hypothetical protein
VNVTKSEQYVYEMHFFAVRPINLNKASHLLSKTQIGLLNNNNSLEAYANGLNRLIILIVRVDLGLWAWNLIPRPDGRC